MTDDERLREMLDDGTHARMERTRSTALKLVAFAVICALLVMVRDPQAWWIWLVVAPLCLLPVLPLGRHDAAIRRALLERPDDVVEITHHLGKPTSRERGMRGVVAKGMRNASRDQYRIWIVARGGPRVTLLFDPASGPEALDLLAERCPHVAVRHGLPAELADRFVVE